MYVCNDCYETFEEPNSYEESHGFDYPPYEKFYICPHCKSSSFEEYKGDERLDMNIEVMNMDELEELKDDIIRARKYYDKDDFRYINYTEFISNIDYVIEKTNH